MVDVGSSGLEEDLEDDWWEEGRGTGRGRGGVESGRSAPIAHVAFPLRFESQVTISVAVPEVSAGSRESEMVSKLQERPSKEEGGRGKVSFELELTRSDPSRIDLPCPSYPPFCS